MNCIKKLVTSTDLFGNVTFCVRKIVNMPAAHLIGKFF